MSWRLKNDLFFLAHFVGIVIYIAIIGWLIVRIQAGHSWLVALGSYLLYVAVTWLEQQRPIYRRDPKRMTGWPGVVFASLWPFMVIFIVVTKLPVNIRDWLATPSPKWKKYGKQ